MAYGAESVLHAAPAASPRHEGGSLLSGADRGLRTSQYGCLCLHHMLRRMSCLPWLQTISLWELFIQGWSWACLKTTWLLSSMQHLPLFVSRRCLSSLQAVDLQAAICPSMGAFKAWKDAAATISRLDPLRFDHVEQEVNRECADWGDCPIDDLTGLGWDGHGILIPGELFDTGVSLHTDHLAIPPDPS